MSDKNWFALDNNVKYWLPKTRKYTELEALVSHMLDLKLGNIHSLSGYSSLWGWSRTKVRKFLKELNSKGHLQNRGRTVKGQEVVIKNIGLKIRKNSEKTTKEQAKDTTIDTETETDIKDIPDSPLKESVKGGGGGRKNGKFKVPTLEEVTVYCKDRNSVVDPQHFLDSNETKGWVVGKLQTPMKCWKAAIRTWETNAKKYNPTQQVSRPNQKSDVDKMMEAYGENN